MDPGTKGGIISAAQIDRGEVPTIGREIIRRAGYGTVNLESITRYLEALRETGIVVRSALAANLSYSSINALRKRDPEFAAAEEEAKQLWIAENIDTAFRRFGIDGVRRKILNPKTGEILDGELVIQPQIALAFARKFDPAYREKQEVDHRVSGGVVVVTAPITTDTDLEALARRMEQTRDVIDGTATPLPATSPAP